MQPMSPGMENMSQLEFGPTNFFNTRRCSIARDGVPIGEIECAMIGQNASIAICGARYAAARENISRGTYYLAAANGTRLANAEKPYAFERLFTVRFGARTITLRAMAALGRAYVLTEKGSISARSCAAAFSAESSTPRFPTVYRRSSRRSWSGWSSRFGAASSGPVQPPPLPDRQPRRPAGGSRKQA